jgi:hypothetical protein
MHLPFAVDRGRKAVMAPKYDTIGIHYAELRRPDRRIAEIIENALGPARRVLNVGAGTGSYEPPDRSLVVGYGGSAILGYLLSLSLLPATTGAAARTGPTAAEGDVDRQPGLSKQALPA